MQISCSSVYKWNYLWFNKRATGNRGIKLIFIFVSCKQWSRSIFITVLPSGEICLLRAKSYDKFHHWVVHLQVCSHGSMSNTLQASVCISFSFSFHACYICLHYGRLVGYDSELLWLCFQLIERNKHSG